MLEIKTVRGVQAALLFAAAVQAHAATPAPAPKGVLVPAHYTEDIGFTDVFFVTPEIGWVAGDGNTILKTTDGGASWTAQLGGDPESPERAARELFFLDERLGWATAAKSGGGDYNLMHTRDGGENWMQVGEVSGHYDHFEFLSETVGVIVLSDRILRTADGGRSWTPALECRAKVEVEGLPRTVTCDLYSLSFASDRVGYAAGGTSAAKVGLVAKTVDGGESWQVLTVPYEGTAGSDHSDILFIDENTGYVRFGHQSNGQLFRTTDGGATWTGVAGSPGKSMRFADPEVGWCLDYSRLSFTSDGGKRWSSRNIAFPAPPSALSFPRRDTAYIVGEHGMIFRYRLLSESEPAPAKSLAAPAMPPLANAVLEEIEQLEAELAEIDAGIEGAAEAEGGAGWAETPWPQEIAGLQESVDALATGVPELGRRHRNLNLVALGLELLGELSDQGSALEQSFAGLRQAGDPESAAAALAEMQSRVAALKSSIEPFRTGK
jgi:photosystem II stability/assembly factor-like uncharacterized protein